VAKNRVLSPFRQRKKGKKAWEGIRRSGKGGEKHHKRGFFTRGVTPENHGKHEWGHGDSTSKRSTRLFSSFWSMGLPLTTKVMAKNKRDKVN